MNDKKDDSEGKYDPGDDTASLLESLFKDTKSSRIKVVRRRMRPKSGVKKRVVPKQRNDVGERTSQTPAQKQGRPLPSIKSSEATKSKTLSRKRPQPGSTLPKDPKTEQSRQSLRRKSTAGAKPTSKSRMSGGERIAKSRAPKKENPSFKTITGPGEERTESLDKSVLNSLASMASGIKGSKKSPHRELSLEERRLLKTKKTGGEKTSEADDLGTGPPSDIEGIAGTDEEITEVLEKTTLDSMISELERSRKEGDDKASTKKSPAIDEEETGDEIFFDSGDPKGRPSSDIEGTAGTDEEITEVLEKTALNSMISALEGSGDKGDDKASAKQSPISEEEEVGVEIFFDSGDLKEETSSDIEGITGADEEITEVLEKTALNSMISALERNREEKQDQPWAEKSSVSEEGEADAGIVVDSDDLKEEVAADTERIDGATEEEPLSQEKPAAPSSITIEDSLLEASVHEAYSESTLEEKSIPEDRKEGVEETPQSIDIREERPSDSVNAVLIKEKTLSQEKPAASPSIPSKIPGNKADTLEVHHILEDEESWRLEDKKEGIKRASEAVGLEIETLSDLTEPAKEEPRFQEMPVPNLISSEDSIVNQDEDELQRSAAEEESLDLEEDIVLTEEDLQLIGSSKRRSMVIRIGLPIVLFGVLVLILSIQYSPLDYFRREQTQKLASDKSVKVSSPKKQEITPETLSETAPAARQRVQHSTPTPTEKEIVRAPVPRKRDAASQPQKETVAAVTREVQPSTAESPTVLAMKESIEGSSPAEQNAAPKTSKETLAVTEQEVRPETPQHATSPPPSDAAAKEEANQQETSKSYPYSVYLGSYSTLESVEKAVLKYNENGLTSLYWQEVDLGDKGIWYRVFTGHFETVGEAEEYVKERQLADAEVRKTRSVASMGSISVKDVVPQGEASEKQRLLPEATAGSSYPYSVYIGSYKDLDRARKAASDFQTKGPSYWVKTDLGDKGIWYRVFIGWFQTRDHAETFIETHQIADGESRRTTYANFIGTYSSEEELDKMRLSLLNLEFSPYVIEASGGGSRLFTGAFYQKARAEKEHLDLKAKGIQSQTVER